jgi:exodeoxyribonuclease V alpha subunit
MVVKNDYQRGVFNGDLGLVADIATRDNEDGEGVVVDFDGSRVHFAPYVLNELPLAYACTVHKSQGGEFPVVVEVCTRQSWIMLQRNLLYTGVTRAKERHVLVCQEDAVRRAVENDRIAERNSRLTQLLRR